MNSPSQGQSSMFFSGSTGTGNSSIFPPAANAATQNSQPQSSGFQFGQPNAGSSGNAAVPFGTGASTGTGGDFKFGTPSTATLGNNPPSSFNYGSTSSTPAASTFNPLGTSTFNSGNSFNSSAPQVAAPLVASLSNYPFQYIQQCYDHNHSNYRFRAFFYNVADDLTEAQRLERQTQKPANVSDALWFQTQNDNPDSTRMIPVLANGFNDLHSRARWEDEVIQAHTEKLNELHEKSSKLLRDLDIDLTAKLIATQQRHQALSLRLLKIMKGMEILRRSGSKLTPAESQAMTKLKNSLFKLSNGILESGSLHNLSFQMESLLESGRLDAFRSAKAIKPANEESAAALQSILQEQQESLKNMVDSIQRDLSDLQVIKAGYRPL